MSNDALALAARKALHDPKFETQPGYCQRFVRQVLESVYGGKYDAFCKDSAEHSRQAWIAAGRGFTPTGETAYQTGDILYKHDGTVGHVGIYVGRLHLAEGDNNGYVTENSSVHNNGVDGAKGTRTLHDWGTVLWVVRLPPPNS